MYIHLYSDFTKVQRINTKAICSLFVDLKNLKLMGNSGSYEKGKALQKNCLFFFFLRFLVKRYCTYNISSVNIFSSQTTIIF